MVKFHILLTFQIDFQLTLIQMRIRAITFGIMLYLGIMLLVSKFE